MDEQTGGRTDAAFMTSWTFPIPGREQKALEFATQSVEFWSRKAAEGHCTDPEWFFFPDGVNHLMVKGDRVALEELLNHEETRRVLARGSLLLQDWHYGLGDTGSGAKRFIDDWAAELASIV